MPLNRILEAPVLSAVVAAAVVLMLAALVRVSYKKHFNIWLFFYLRQRLRNALRNKKLPERHIIISICDHFDFGSSGKYREGEENVIRQWEELYPPLSDRHRDSNGVNLLHTWFFPPHYNRGDYLERLVKLCAGGYGEIELHLHHDHIEPFPDTSETLRKKIRDSVENYGRFGVFCLPGGKRTFGFIHGDWALDNSRRGGKYCGVNDEIKILAGEGCYADFTFPCLHEAQSSKVNSIYYAVDDPQRPKSHDTGEDVRVGGTQAGDLMIIQGPLMLTRKRKLGFPFFPSIESSELQGFSTLYLKRAATWVKANIHVKGRPEWVFVKLHTHGAMGMNFEHNLGAMADSFFTELERKYNNPVDGYLHYVSAREMYNIIKAAEAGRSGNPHQYRDFEIPRYTYLKEKS